MQMLNPTHPCKKLQSKSINLQKLQLSFAKFIFESIDNDRSRLSENLPWVNYIQSIDDEKKYLFDAMKDWDECRIFDFAIFLNETDHYLGNIGIHHISWKNKSCEIGYWILGEFEGNGFISEAVRVIENELFALGFNRIQIRCNSKNKKSANVPSRLGYVLEGTLREDSIENGAFRDTYVFGKLKTEWRKAQS